MESAAGFLERMRRRHSRFSGFFAGPGYLEFSLTDLFRLRLPLPRSEARR